MKLFIRMIAFGAALVSGGCVSLLPETTPPKPRYHIEASDAASLQGDKVSWSLVIDDPRTTRVYDSVRIAVSTAPGKIEYFAGAEWADRAPRLFLTAVVQTFEDSGRILAVGERASLPLGDLALQTDIRKLELDVRDNEQVTVSIYARLADGRSKVFAARKFETSAPISSDNPDAVIAGFDAAFEKIIADMVAWTFEQGEAAMDGDS